MTLIDAANVGELPEDLAVKVLRIYGDDPLTDLGALMRSTEGTAEQIATVIARQALGREWHDRMQPDTRERIKLTVENHFTPSESPAPDPLMAQAANFQSRDPWRRFEELHEPQHITVLRGASETTIVDTRQGQS